MRIHLGKAEHLVHPLDQPLRYRVLEQLGIGMDRRPVHPHDAYQEQLDQSVPSQDMDGQLPAGRRQAGPRVGLVEHQSACREGLEHRCHRGWSDL